MNINSIIDKLNNELDKLNNTKKENIVDTSSFFTDNEKFNDDFSFDDSNLSEKTKNELNSTNLNLEFSNITPDNDTVSLVKIKEHHLLDVHNMFKKTIRVSLKSFLISISLSFLNLFI